MIKARHNPRILLHGERLTALCSQLHIERVSIKMPVDRVVGTLDNIVTDIGIYCEQFSTCKRAIKLPRTGLQLRMQF